MERYAAALFYRLAVSDEKIRRWIKLLTVTHLIKQNVI